MEGRTAVYRAFGIGGTLLYIGIAGNWGRRWSQHSERSEFYSEVARLEIEWLQTRGEALALETKLIKELKPQHNIRKGGAANAGQLISGGSAEDFPIGWWFHLLGDDGKIEKQGVVITALPGALHVQLFEWMLGGPSFGTRVLPTTDWSKWIFYETNEEMREAYEYSGKALRD